MLKKENIKMMKKENIKRFKKKRKYQNESAQ
jgi:hypothetical protein